MSRASASAPPLRFSARARMVLNGVTFFALLLLPPRESAPRGQGRPGRFGAQCGARRASITARIVLPRAREFLACPQSSFTPESPVIRFYFHPTPNPAKVALFLEELGLPYEVVPVDTSKGEQHSPAFRAINPNGKVPAIVDTEGPGGTRGAGVRFERDPALSRRKDRALPRRLRPIGRNCCRGSFSSPPGSVRSRARRCISSMQRRRRFPTPSTAIGARSSAIIASWTGIWQAASSSSATTIRSPTCPPGAGSRAPRSVLPGEDDPLAAFPNLKRLFEAVDARPAVARAKAVGKDHPFKRTTDEETKRAMFPSNYPEIAM